MNRYAKTIAGPTPQTEPIPMRADQVEMASGGYGFNLDPWKLVERFLVLGTEGGTYYATEKKLTITHATNLVARIAEDPSRVASIILDVAVNRRAPKMSPVVFALALLATKAPSFAFAVLPDVCTIPTHVFEFISTFRALGGRFSGKGLRNALRAWLAKYDATRFAYHAAKYQQREGVSFADVLRLAHAKPKNADVEAIMGWIAGKKPAPEGSIIARMEAAMKAPDADEATAVALADTLSHEMIPSQWRRYRRVMEWLAQAMPYTALVRHLGEISSHGATEVWSDVEKTVVERISNAQIVQTQKIHPWTLLQAGIVYQSGHGVRGSLTWKPNAAIVGALGDALNASGANITKTGKRVLVAIDVSVSMHGAAILGPTIPASTAAAYMASMLVAQEPGYRPVMFDNVVHEPTRPLRSTNDFVAEAGLHSGGTNIASVVEWLSAKKLDVDAAIVLTDHESWAGNQHVVQALAAYRKSINPAFRFVSVCFAGSPHTVNDQKDRLSLDVVGMDAGAFDVIQRFISGDL